MQTGGELSVAFAQSGTTTFECRIFSLLKILLLTFIPLTTSPDAMVTDGFIERVHDVIVTPGRLAITVVMCLATTIDFVHRRTVAAVAAKASVIPQIGCVEVD